MRQARFDGEIRWPPEQTSGEESRRARRTGLLAVAAALVLGVAYTRYGGSVSVDPAMLEFGDQIVGAPGVRAEVTLTGQGLRAVTVGPATLEGAASPAFQVAANGCLDRPLEPGATCPIVLAFAPATPGLHLAWLSVADDTSAGPRRVALVGSAQEDQAAAPRQVAAGGGPSATPSGAAGGSPPAQIGAAGINVRPASLKFGRQAMGTTSAPQKVSVLSTGSAALKLGTVRLGGDTGDFLVDGSGCNGRTLEPSRRCQIEVSFSPGKGRTGDRRARLSLPDNTPAGRHFVEMLGTARAAPPEFTVAPASLQFGDHIVGTKGDAGRMTVTNSSTSPLGPVEVTLADRTNFAMGSDTCSGRTLQPGGSCQVEVVFTPADPRSILGTLDVRASDRRQMVFMTGKGIEAGWCCIGQKVHSLDAATCKAERGRHYSTRKAAEKACAPPAQPVIK